MGASPKAGVSSVSMEDEGDSDSRRHGGTGANGGGGNRIRKD